MAKFVKYLAVALVVTLFATGCQNRKPIPRPEQTLYNGSGSAGGDVLNPMDIYDSDAPGAERSDDWASTGMGENANRLENVLQPIYFDFDTAYVRPDQRAKLEEAYSYMTENSSVKLLVEGYCDSKGTKEYNLALGDKRAESVRNYMLGLGLDELRIETVSFGDLNADENASDLQREKDRRASLVILK